MKRTSRNKGFTLIELIITVAILALVVAPFLSSFATAGNMNVKSKRKQVATNYGEYISEKFKAKTLDKLLSEYDGSVGAEGSNTFDSATGKYTFDISEVPNGVSSDYTAKVELTKSTVDVNADNAMPKLNGIVSAKSFVAMSDFYSNDAAYSSAYSRKATIDIEQDMAKIKVTLSVQYFDASGVAMCSPIKVSTYSYDYMPDLYLMYVPYNANDRIEIYNNVLSDNIFDEDGNAKDLDIYLIQQDVVDSTNPSYSSPKIQPGNVTIESVRDAAGTTYNSASLEEYINNGGVVSAIDRIKVFTNIDTAITGGVMVEKTTQISLYNMVVKVYYKGDEVAKFSGTKTR